MEERTLSTELPIISSTTAKVPERSTEGRGKVKKKTFHKFEIVYNMYTYICTYNLRTCVHTYCNKYIHVIPKFLHYTNTVMLYLVDNCTVQVKKKKTCRLLQGRVVCS